ncbi:MAG TPA: hypothetical protein VHB21_28010, partial [Minicystis sp.]|nr:hypothetical protein [Minicystis sp.]
INVEVDFSGLAPAAAPSQDPEELHRRVRHDARDVETLRALFAAVRDAGDVDRALATAHALVHLGAAREAEREFFEQRRPRGLIQPTSAVSPEAWRRLLFHPDEEPLTSEIFAIVAPAVLLGRVAALRHAKALPALAPEARHDPRTSTIAAVRCLGWAAAILGMPAPPVYAEPERPTLVEVVPAVPPASRLGKLVLSGRTPEELAFAAGRHLACFREEHFVRTLLPSIPELEDVFLAALSVGNPGLPLHADVKRRVVPIAKAIEPLLEPVLVDRLRGAFLRFVEEGGRTNLQRWAVAADRTAARAGMLLAGDLGAAERVLALDAGVDARAFVDDLVVFVTSERYTRLRKQIGVAVTA